MDQDWVEEVDSVSVVMSIQARSVLLRKQKWGGLPHGEFACTALGSDLHGTWLLARSPAPRAQACVSLIPDRQWWMAAFIIENSGDRKVWVDISMPAVWNEDWSEVAVVDLEMDVERIGTGPTVLLDVEDFEAARLARGYPESVVEAAKTSAQALFDRVRDHDEPFDGFGWRWLETALGSLA